MFAGRGFIYILIIFPVIFLHDCHYISIKLVPSSDRPQLSPHNAVWPCTHMAAVPTTICSWRYLLGWGFMLFNFLPLLFCDTKMHCSIKYLSSHHMMSQNSAHKLKFGLAPTLQPCQQQYAAAGMILCEVLCSTTFYHCFCDTKILFQLNTNHHITGSATTQPTNWSLALHPHFRHANNNMQQQDVFRVSFYVLFTFYTIVFYDTKILFQLNTYRSIMGPARTQHTNWSLAHTLTWAVWS